MSLEINVVEDLSGLLVGGLQLGSYLLDAQQLALVAEDVEFISEVTDLVVVKACEGLELGRTKHLVSHLNN